MLTSRSRRTARKPTGIRARPGRATPSTPVSWPVNGWPITISPTRCHVAADERVRQSVRRMCARDGHADALHRHEPTMHHRLHLRKYRLDLLLLVNRDDNHRQILREIEDARRVNMPRRAVALDAMQDSGPGDALSAQ